ncbi:MAG: zinc-ribbon domain-containing protein [Candidatus Heimdallarchaeaceae archaeon]
MFCRFCRAEIEDGSKFCPFCGASLEENKDFVGSTKEVKDQSPQSPPPYYAPQAQPPVLYYNRKEVSVAILLSMFAMAGTGHIYAGKVGKGIGLMVGFIISLAMSYVSLYLFFIHFFDITVFLILFLISAISVFVIYIYTIINVSTTVKKYNQFLITNGRPPTSKDKW